MLWRDLCDDGPVSDGSESGRTTDDAEQGSPLDRLGALAMQSVPVDDERAHHAIYTMDGLLTVLWHGSADLDRVVVCAGGAMGGLLGPDGGVYHRLGRLLVPRGIGVLRVGYRRPNDLDSCVHDMLATMELAGRHGAERFVTIGHSFGGAVAIGAAARLDTDAVPGVVTLATQSAGCEPVGGLADRDLLFVHGTADGILPHRSSEMVRMLAGVGELWLIPGADHLLAPAGDEILARLVEHLPRVLGSGRSGEVKPTG